MMYRVALAVLLAIACSLLPSAPAAALTFGPPGPIHTGNAFGDFFSYSMHLENCLFTNPCDNNVNNSSDPFFIQAATGQTGNLAVLYQHPAETNFPSPFGNNQADNSYATPTGKATSFSTTTSDPTNGPLAGDGNSWDVTLTALQTYLAGHDLVYLLSNNQVGGAGTDLLVWGRVTLIDTDPAGGINAPICFDLTNTQNPSPLSYTAANCSAAPTEPSGSSTGDFVSVLGRFCINSVTGAVVPCDDPAFATNRIGPFNSNVGNNAFDFAVFSPELNNLAFWISQGYTVAQHWFELRNINDGDETIVICNVCDIAVPAPQALSMVLAGALGALGAGMAWKRRAVQ